MATAQVILTDEETSQLRHLAQETGRSQEELLHDAVERYLSQTAVRDRQQLLRRARGVWKNRTDLPDFAQLRSEFDR